MKYVLQNTRNPWGKYKRALNAYRDVYGIWELINVLALLFEYWEQMTFVSDRHIICYNSSIVSNGMFRTQNRTRYQ